MRWLTLARASKLALGALLSGGWMVCGFWVLENYSPALAVGPIAAGQYVLMHLVADDLVPGASPLATGFMKLTAGLVFWGSALLALWSIRTGTPI